MTEANGLDRRRRCCRECPERLSEFCRRSVHTFAWSSVQTADREQCPVRDVPQRQSHLSIRPSVSVRGRPQLPNTFPVPSRHILVVPASRHDQRSDDLIGGAIDFRFGCEVRIDVLQELCRIAACLGDDPSGQSIWLFQQCLQQMLRLDDLLLVILRDFGCRNNCLCIIRTYTPLCTPYTLHHTCQAFSVNSFCVMRFPARTMTDA